MKKALLSFLLLLGCLAEANAQQIEQTPAPMWRHPWQGAKVGYLGDSITDPRNKASQKKYWWWLKQWLDIDPYVYGVSGRQWNDVLRQANLLKREHGKDVDAIFIFMGTNDWNNDVPLGDWYEVRDDSVAYAHGGSTKHMELRRHRVLNTDTRTLRGRINVALDSLKRMYPDKQVVLLTPIHRARFYASEKNWQPTEDYANRLGLFIDDYVQCVKEAGNVWAVPVIDWNALSGLYPMHECQDYFDHDNDRLHPNDRGHERLARTLYQQLVVLPCRL
jgi:lysophospholipase L1-like esterase